MQRGKNDYLRFCGSTKIKFGDHCFKPHAKLKRNLCSAKLS